MNVERIFEKADKLGAARTRIVVSANFVTKNKDGDTGSQMCKEEMVMPHPKGDDWEVEEKLLITEMEDKINEDIEALIEKGAIIINSGKAGKAIFWFVQWEIE